MPPDKHINGIDPSQPLEKCIIALYRLGIKELEKQQNELKKNAGINEIHQTRVASRKLQTLFDIFGEIFPSKFYKENLKKIKSVISLLGGARENDVSIKMIDAFAKTLEPGERIALQLLSARLRRGNHIEKEKLLRNKKVSKNIRKLKKGFLDRLSRGKKFRKTKYIHPKASFKMNGVLIIPRLFDGSMEFKKDVLDHPENERELHRMRIKAKPLRYALDTFSFAFPGAGFADILKEVKFFVENLGLIHDIDVLIPLIRDYMQEIALYNKVCKTPEYRISLKPVNGFIRKLQSRRNAYFKEVNGILKKWDEDNFRERLILTLSN